MAFCGAGFADVAVKFRSYHSNSLNVALHLVTTPAGIVSALVFLAKNSNEQVFFGIIAAYVISLIPMLRSFGLWAATTVAMILITAAALLLAPSLSTIDNLKLLAAAYVGQELAHFITGEKTFQGSYMGLSNWPALLLEHTYYLLPLCLDSLMHMKDSFASWIVAHDYVVRCKLQNKQDRAALKTVYDFVTKENPSREHTAHWWYQRLEGEVQDAFRHVMESDPVKEMFEKRFRPDLYNVEPISGMNEIYVASSKHNNNSDTVFYMKHCDGPWSVYPFCHVYRCMVAVNENKQVETIFPMEPSGGCLSDGDVVGFDYNREIHVISDLPTKNVDRRITLKLHYVVYPKCLGPLGKLKGTLAKWYNTTARNLFLATITPKNLLWRFMAWNVLTFTNLVFKLELLVGLNNIAFVSALYLIGQRIHPYFFMCATSFTHYCMYIATYHYRDRINFGVFKRNVVFFKTIALTHLCWNYLANFEFDPVSVAMLVCGYGLSTAATVALGLDQTYFGVELGVMKPNFVSGFPYNCVPHPMIVGSMCGLLGFHKMASFRAELPYLVPVHCAMYMMHMLQEQFYDIYKKDWGSKPAASAGKTVKAA